MTVDPIVLITIIGMATVTYATRLSGFLLFGRAGVNGRLGVWLRYIPGAVLISIIAPAVLPVSLSGIGAGASGVLTAGIPEAVAAIVTALVAVRSKSLLFAMLAGVATVWVLRQTGV